MDQLCTDTVSPYPWLDSEGANRRFETLWGTDTVSPLHPKHSTLNLKLGRSATLRGGAAPRTLLRNVSRVKRVTLPQRFLANGSNVYRGGPIPRRSSQGLWQYTLLDSSSPVPEMYSQCQTDQFS